MAYLVIGIIVGFIATLALEALLFYLLIVRRNC